MGAARFQERREQLLNGATPWGGVGEGRSHVDNTSFIARLVAGCETRDTAIMCGKAERFDGALLGTYT